jgi:hypothetical protein
MKTLRNNVHVETRAAEIYSAITTTYAAGGWFEMMTRDEGEGWVRAAMEWFAPDSSPLDLPPRNRREQAGALAFYMYMHDAFDMHDACLSAVLAERAS